jgi:hypothetical protein
LALATPANTHVDAVHRDQNPSATRPSTTFTDPLLDWASSDRATLTLSDMDDVRTRLPAIVALVNRWMRATPWS